MTIKTTAIRAVNSALAAILTPNPWEGKAFGIDVYDPAVMTLPPGSVDFVGLRIGGMSGKNIYKNPNFGVQVQAVWDAGAIPLAYFIVNPAFYPLRETTEGNLKNMEDDVHPVLNLIKEQLRSGNTAWKKVGGLFWDCELDGDESWEALTVDDARGRIRNQQSKGLLPPFFQGIYSRASWINDRVHIRTLVENHPELMVWTANYLMAFPGQHSPIAEKRTNELPLRTQRAFLFGDHPLKPKEYPYVFQYHGTFKGAKYSTCPEVVADNKPMGLDLDIFNGTRADLYKIVGWVDPLTVPPPPVDPPPTETPDLTAILARLDALELSKDNLEAITVYQAGRIAALETFKENVKGA